MTFIATEAALVKPVKTKEWRFADRDSDNVIKVSNKDHTIYVVAQNVSKMVSG